MPELLVDYITSLDGYGAADGWPGFWGLEGPEYLAWLEDEPEADYTVLIGANTYRLMSGLADEGEPGTEGRAGLRNGAVPSGRAGAAPTRPGRRPPLPPRGRAGRRGRARDRGPGRTVESRLLVQPVGATL